MVNGLIIFHVVVCVLLTVVVLLQFGKGAEAGAMMGSGSSQAIFTSNSKGNFFTKMTTALAILFMVNSVILSTITSKENEKSLLDGEAPVAQPLNSDAEDAAQTTTTAKEATEAPKTEAKPAEAPKAETKPAETPAQ